MRLIDADRLKQAFITDFWEHFTQTHDSDQVALFEMFCEDLDEFPTVECCPNCSATLTNLVGVGKKERRFNSGKPKGNACKHIGRYWFTRNTFRK